jgi:hypothetical protein
VGVSDVVVIGVSLVIMVGVIVAVVIWRGKPKEDVSPEERYRREMANLRPAPQTWRAKRSEARRAQLAGKRRRA